MHKTTPPREIHDFLGMLMADLCEAASASVAQIFLLPEPMSGDPPPGYAWLVVPMEGSDFC